jgi:iron complex transport system substrate-binding protein
MGKRHDIVQLGGENLAAGLNGESLFLFASDEKDATALETNPLLSHLAAVQKKQVYALGTETFRLDYYSATQVLERMSQLFGSK